MIAGLCGKMVTMASSRRHRDEPAVKHALSHPEFTEMILAVREWFDITSRLRSFALRTEARGIVRSGTWADLDTAMRRVDDLLVQLGQDTEASRLEARQQMEAWPIVEAAADFLEREESP